jgi:uncharacterized protein
LEDSERSARRDFHLALPFGIVPGLGVLVSFALSRREVSGVWGRRIRWLALVDLLVVLAVASFAVFGPPQAPLAIGKGRIGITPAGALNGVGVESVAPSSPAARAGLLQGDVILSVDGKPVHSSQELIAELDEKQVELVVRRAGEQLHVLVTPEKRAVELFFVQPAEQQKWEPWIFIQLGLTLAALGFLALRARSRGVSVLPPALMLGVLIFASLVQQGTAWAISRRMGGFSAFAWLASTLIFTASMLCAAALALRIAVRRGLVPAPHWNPPEPALVARGLLYVVSFGARAGVLAWAFWSATRLLRFLPAQDPWGAVEQLPPLAAMLFALGAVAIAPAAEEILFRGLFLPWLEHLFEPRVALLVSAAVFALQHIVYGPGAAFIVVVGLVLGWARQRTGGLAAPIFIHTVNNALVTLLRLGH